MKNIQFHFIQPGTPAYEEMIQLRLKVLLEPINIPRTYINEQKEAGDILVGAYQDGILIGCCILTHIDDTAVQLRQMAVALPVQSKGIGRHILTFAESIAREKGYQILMMHARDSVIPFYQKCGYTIAGDPFFEVGIAHHKMQKGLSAENNKNQ